MVAGCRVWSEQWIACALSRTASRKHKKPLLRVADEAARASAGVCRGGPAAESIRSIFAQIARSRWRQSSPSSISLLRHVQLQ